MPGRQPTSRYEVRVVLRAPLAFVYRWCTDFQPGDAKLEGDDYERRILERSSRRVVYEDLALLPDGWHWARHSVTLHPPDRWHSDSVGNYREVRLDYRLVARGSNATELQLTMRRRPTGLGGRPPPKRKFEAALRQSWKAFGRSLEREHRARARR